MVKQVQALQTEQTEQTTREKEEKSEEKFLQPSLNIGLVGHVDHGKTTLLYKLSGVWASKHSEELRRGITIKLGYADVLIRRCKCEEHNLTITERCKKCEAKAEPVKYVSFVDAPGHEMLMATMLSGAAIIDAAVLVIAATEKCPQPQTKEHLLALRAKGISQIIIVQNKIDLLSKEEVLRSYEDIKKFVAGSIAENAPIIPISAQQGLNIDILFEEILRLKEPERDVKSEPLFLIARTFDVNKPGIEVSNLVGGVLGGTLRQGLLRKGDKIEIRPGLLEEKGGKMEYKVVKTTIADLVSGKNHLKEALPSGNLGVSTMLDPFLTKGDALAGSVLGLEGKMPDVAYEIKCKTKLFEKVVGAEKELVVELIKMNEPLLLSINTSITVGNVVELLKDSVKVKLRVPVAVLKGSNVGIARNIQGRWRLIGYGVVV